MAPSVLASLLPPWILVMSLFPSYVRGDDFWSSNPLVTLHCPQARTPAPLGRPDLPEPYCSLSGARHLLPTARGQTWTPPIWDPQEGSILTCPRPQSSRVRSRHEDQLLSSAASRTAILPRLAVLIADGSRTPLPSYLFHISAFSFGLSSSEFVIFVQPSMTPPWLVTRL